MQIKCTQYVLNQAGNLKQSIKTGEENAAHDAFAESGSIRMRRQ